MCRCVPAGHTRIYKVPADDARVASPLVLMVGGVANPEDPIERASTVENPLSVGEGSMLGEERPCRPIVQHLPPPASGMWKPGGKVFRHVEDDHPL